MKKIKKQSNSIRIAISELRAGASAREENEDVNVWRVNYPVRVITLDRRR